MGATRLCAYSRAVGAVAWGAVAAAAQARWFADADFDHEFDSSRADEDRAADSAAIDAPSSRADVFLLSDACVDALCAAEAAAASAGWAPAPPATGPLEAAARARDRGIEGAIRAEVLADARRVFVDASDAELYATFRAGAESEAIEANRRQSPMSWDPSKEDAGLFSQTPPRREMTRRLPEMPETPPRLLPRSRLPRCRRWLVVSPTSRSARSSPRSGRRRPSWTRRRNAGRRRTARRSFARWRGRAAPPTPPTRSGSSPPPRARGRGRGTPAVEDPSTLRLLPISFPSDATESSFGASSGPSRSPTRGRTRRACSVTTRGTSRRVGSRRRTRRGTRSSAPPPRGETSEEPSKKEPTRPSRTRPRFL